MANRKVGNVQLALEQNSDNTMVASWTFDTKKNDHTDHYEVEWQYTTGNVNKKGSVIWFIGNEGTEKGKQSTYSVPANAIWVRFRAKPVSGTYKSGKTEKSYWTGDWCARKKFNYKNRQLPDVPPTPTVTISGNKLTAVVDNYTGSNITAANKSMMQFQIVKNNGPILATKKASIVKRRSALTITVALGNLYKVRVRGTNKWGESNWTEYTDNVSTIPTAVKSISSIKAKSENSVELKWSSASPVTEYEIQYADASGKFDVSDDVQSISTGNTRTTHLISGLGSGQRWYFRVRGKNSEGEGGWCSKNKDKKYPSIVIGTTPSAPTTWSYYSTSTPSGAIVLNWQHNTEDGSDQTGAQIEVTVKRGSSETTKTFTATTASRITVNNGTNKLDPATLLDGDILKWRVRTKGAINTYSPWSTNRTVTIYAEPTVTVDMQAAATGDDISVFTAYPFTTTLTAQPATQNAISFNFTITSNTDYDTVDEIGRVTHVRTGEVIFSKYINDPGGNTVTFDLGPGDVHLETGAEYTANVVVGMNSGLQAEDDISFSTEFEDDEFELEAEIGINTETLEAIIRPYCVGPEFGEQIYSGAVLGVYRREPDGTFTEIQRDISMADNITVTDPHPALDLARYRITAISDTTGRVTFFDATGVDVGEPSIVIQWDEDWTDYNSNGEDESSAPAWSGSMLKLPYNVDISDRYAPNVSLVEYIGREHPVSYYGTQKGHTSSWKADIPKDDTDTLYAIRRLARYSGDVYVREPNGTGYWAQVNVSYDIEHDNQVVSVSFDVTRVEGGV